MAKKNKLPLLGVLAATPVMTASVAQAQAFDVGPAAAIASVASSAQAAALKTMLLTLTPGEKLSIAGDRLGGQPSAPPVPGFGPNDGRSGRQAAPASGACHKTGVAKSKASGDGSDPKMIAGRPTHGPGTSVCGVAHPQHRIVGKQAPTPACRPTGATTATCAAGAARGRATYCSNVESSKVQAGQVDRRLTPGSANNFCVAKPLAKGAGQGGGASTHVTAPTTKIVKGSGRPKGPGTVTSLQDGRTGAQTPK